MTHHPATLADVWKRPELAEMVRLLAPLDVYLVGGAVRDLLLGRTVKDFDFLVDCDAQQLLDLRPRLKAATGVSVIVLDGELGILRVCYRETEGLDLAARQGATVEIDLARRDVTFNAMALRSDGQLLDPFGGERDLQRREVRITSPQVLHHDPLRVLRCLRLAAVLGFHLGEETRARLKEAAPGLVEIAGERIGEELARFLTYADPSHIHDFRQAQVAQAVWGLDDSAVAWQWLQQWCAKFESPRGSSMALSLLAALLEPAAASSGQAMMERIKLSRAQMKFLRQWWAGGALLREQHPSSPRGIHALLAVAEKSLEGLLSFAALPAFPNPVPADLAQRIAEAGRGEGELRLEPLPLGGEELCQHFDQRPGVWLGPMLSELQAAWACREINDIDALLAYAATLRH